MNESPIRTSAETDKLDTALAAAQVDLSNPVKTRIANVEGISKKTGKAFKIGYAYADIADILADVRPVLAGHGVTIYQVPRLTENLGALLITTRLAHAGQWIEGDYPVCKTGEDHQAMGMAMTYARRHALGAMIGIAPENDADGAGAATSEVKDPDPPKDGKRNLAVVAAEAAMLTIENVAGLDAWGEANDPMLKTLTKADSDHLKAFFRRRRTELEERAASDPSQHPADETQVPADADDNPFSDES